MSTREIRFREERPTGGSTDDIGFGIVYDVYEGDERRFGILVQMSGTAGAIAENTNRDPAALLRENAEAWAAKALKRADIEPPAQGEFVRAWITADKLDRL